MLSQLISRPPHMQVPIPGPAAATGTKAFVEVNGDLQMWWPNVILSNEQQDALETVLAHLHYLGRTESWCIITASSDGIDGNCIPLVESSGNFEHCVIEVMVPKASATMQDMYATCDGIRKCEDGMPDGAQRVPYVISSACMLPIYSRAQHERD